MKPVWPPISRPIQVEPALDEAAQQTLLDSLRRRGRWKRGTEKRGTLKVWKALQFSKAKATEQRSRHIAIRVSRLCHVATSGSVNRAQTKWNVRVVVVPSDAQTFRWSCVFFDFHVTLCTVISDFLHWTTWSFSDNYASSYVLLLVLCTSVIT